MAKEKTKRVTKKVLVKLAEATGTAVISCVAAVIGGKIAFAELAKDGVNVKVNKVEDASVSEEV